jgi:C-5 cytosine-specific DNA methylase
MCRHASLYAASNRASGVIEGREVPTRPLWSVGWTDEPDRAHQQHFDDEQHRWTKVREVRPGCQGVEVFNLAVAEDESYVADGMVVHNCTELSPSGRGSRLTKAQRARMERGGHVEAAGFKRTRATFLDVIRAAEVHRYKAVIAENVPEAADWVLWSWWLSGMVALGYSYQLVSVSSAHVGGAGNPHAPQWRDRLYIVFTLNGIPLPDVTPRPVAWCSMCEIQVRGIQAWKQESTSKPRVGKYGQQYVYVCERCGTVAEPYVLPAAAILDWDDLGSTLAERSVPLVPNTIRRIELGRQLATARADVGPPPFGELHAPGGRTISRGRRAGPTPAPIPASCPERYGVIVPYRNRSLPTTTD